MILGQLFKAFAGQTVDPGVADMQQMGLKVLLWQAPLCRFGWRVIRKAGSLPKAANSRKPRTRNRSGCNRTDRVGWAFGLWPLFAMIRNFCKACERETSIMRWATPTIDHHGLSVVM